MSDESIKTRQVLDALRDRHPAHEGEWTVFEEAWLIDFLAIRVWGGRRESGSHRRIAYEVKVSRGDYRRELLTPAKRSAARRLVHQFYLAVPEGLLKPHELAWTPPADHEPQAVKVDTPEAVAWRQGGYRGPQPRQMNLTRLDEVTANAPTLWVPADCGLVVVRRTQAGELASKIAKKSPRNATVPEMTEREWVELARMAVNPTRHRDALARAKAFGERLATLEDAHRELRDRLDQAYSLIEDAAVEEPDLGSYWTGPWPARGRGEVIEDARVQVYRPSWMTVADAKRVHLRWADQRQRPSYQEHSVRLGEFITHYRRELVLA